MVGRTARGGRVVLAALAALVFAGCSLNKEVDTDRAEAEIKRNLTAQIGEPLRNVRCPDEVDAEKGARFSCTAVAVDGSRIPIRVTQTDGDGGVRWRIAR
jgi:Domain of unknown function (DUF4333)